MQFIRVRCLRSYPLPVYLDLGVDVTLDSIVDTPTLLDRCTTIYIRSPEQWRIVGSRLPRLKRLVLSCGIPRGNWKEIPTLQSLKLERLGRVGGLWAVPLFGNIVQLEAIHSSSLWHDMQMAATLVPKVQVLRLSMIELSSPHSVLEDFFFSLINIPAHLKRERTFGQVTHLVLRYSNTNLDYVSRHPLPFVTVPCLIHLEILLHHLRNINGLLILDYPTVTRLTVIVFANPSPLVMNITEDPADIQCLLDLMKRLPNLKNGAFTVTSFIMATLRAELGRNPALYPPLSTIEHYLPTP